MAIVQNLVDSYVSNPRTIILAVVRANNQCSQQHSHLAGRLHIHCTYSSTHYT